MSIENTIFRGFSLCNVKPSYYSTFNVSLFVHSVALCLSKAPFVVRTAVETQLRLLGYLYFMLYTERSFLLCFVICSCNVKKNKNWPQNTSIVSAQIALWAARQHTVPSCYGRPEFESQLEDLSWSHPHHSVLICPVIVKANMPKIYFKKNTSIVKSGAISQKTTEIHLEILKKQPGKHSPHQHCDIRISSNHVLLRNCEHRVTVKVVNVYLLR